MKDFLLGLVVGLIVYTGMGAAISHAQTVQSEEFIWNDVWDQATNKIRIQ